MPNRILREGILTSERVDRLPGWAQETFYRRLMNVVDDFGRYYANPSLLRAACYPLKLDKVSNADVGKWLSDCENAALVSTYEVEGKRYLQLLDFRQQVRAKDSKFPPMPSERTSLATHPPNTSEASAHLDGGGGEDGGEDSAERGTAASPPAPVCLIPLNGGQEYPISGEDIDAWSATYPAVDVEHHLRRMREWCLSNPTKRKTRNGIRRFITQWLGKEQDRGAQRSVPVDPFAGAQ